MLWLAILCLLPMICVLCSKKASNSEKIKPVALSIVELCAYGIKRNSVK